MKRDEVFKEDAPRASDFEFSAGVAEVFDDMLARSVPLYHQQQHMLQEMGSQLWVPGTVIYDLGCSTGTTLLGLAERLSGPCQLVGYDNSLPMLAQARAKIEAHARQDWIELRYGDLNAPPAALSLENSGLVLLCWTLQFVRPLQRDRLIRHIYEALPENGALLVTDKILTQNGHLNPFFIELYYDFKQQHGYSESEILRKRQALENVLVPYRIEENIELLTRNGFEIVETFFQWYNFAGFVCIKKPAHRKP